MTVEKKTGDFGSVIASDRANVWHHLTQHKAFEQSDPMVVVEGKGMRIWDAHGKEYLDATSGGVWTVNVGYGRESIANAVRDQLQSLCFFANTAGNVPAAEFASELVARMPGMSRVYFSTSGSESNEKAYKMARQIGQLRTDGVKHKIIYRDRDYHGTTITALSSTGQYQRKAQYGPYTPGFVEMPHCNCYRCPFGKEYGSCNIECAQELETIIQREGPETIASLVLEPITAGGGVITPVPEYFPIVQDICRKYDVLLHIDEVVCGLGRTGKWFGYEHYGVQPDMVTLAKGVASGYAAIGCTVTTEKVFDEFKAQPDDALAYFRDISTFGGCTSGPAAASENIRIIEQEKLLQNAADTGDYMLDQLRLLQDKHQVIGDVRGIGLIAGIELVEDRHSKKPVVEQKVAGVAAECSARGVIIGRTNRSFSELNNTLAFCPALIASKSDIDEIVSTLDAALTDIFR